MNAQTRQRTHAEPTNMSAKLFFVIAGFLCAVVAAVILRLAEAPIGWIVTGMLVALGIGTCLTYGEFDRGPAFVEMKKRWRRAMWLATSAAAAAHCGWVLWVQIDPEPWKAHTFRLLGLSLATWAIASYWERRLTCLTPKPSPVRRAAVEVYVPEVEPADDDERRMRDAVREFEAILAAAGRPFHEVKAVDPMPYGASFVVRTMTPLAASSAETARLELEAARQTVGDEEPKQIKPVVIRQVESVQPGDEDAIARAVEDAYDVVMDTSWVQIDPTRGAGRTRVTVTTQDVLALTHPYKLVNEPLPPGAKIDIGPQVHGEPILIDPLGHGAIIGNTGSGKTMFSAACCAEVMRLPGRRTVIGTEKVWDWVGQFLAPLLDTDLPLPIEAFVGMDDCLMLFTEIMNEVRWRQSLPHHERHDLLPWFIWIEEAPAFLGRRDKRVHFDGREWVASDLLAYIMRLARSAGIFIIVMAQEWDNAMFGDQAASIKANMNYIVILRSKDGDERSRAFGRGAANLANLYNPGEYYVRANSDPVRGKGRYIQEEDVRLAVLHDGPRMSEVALARAQLATRLPQGRWAPPTEWYAENRPHRMTPAYQAYLQGHSTARPMTATAVAAAPSADDKFDAALRRAGLLAVEGPTPPTPDLHIVEGEPKRGPRQQIADLVLDADREMTRAEILTAFKDVSETSIDNHLSALVRQRKLRRPSPGVYAPVEAA